ncbi:hypothetical protein ACROYT_G005931 [Oculina patagonica]
MDSFGKEALEAHNKFRKAHQAPPLTWSSALARDAETWAKQIAREGRLRHDDTKDGENVFMVFGREIDGTDAVNSWYSEVKDYDFSKSGYQSNTGHFTQVVWKGSKELGIGKAKSADGKMFVVGRYRPAGNNMRAFKENVFTSKDGPVKIPEKEPAKKGSAPVYQRQKHEERPPVGRERRTEETVVTYPDGTKKTVVSTVTVTLKGNDQSGYSKETVTTVHETRKQDAFSRDMKTALPDQVSPSSKAPRDTKGEGASHAPSSSSKSAFSKQALDAHNKYRAKHRVSPLKWSDEIARDAQAWADKLARARSLQHASKSERKETGENIAMFSGKFESAGEEATNMWYAEVKDYRFDKPGFQGNTGHFTQVVWKESKELGMGRAQTADGRLSFVVARYKPAGNLLNHFQENVFKG